MHQPRFLPFGDAALLVEFGEDIDRAVSDTVVALDARMVAAGLPGVVETVPSFRSLLVQFDPLVTDADAVAAGVGGLLPGLEGAPTPGRLWRLPVCHEGDFAPDLADVAAAGGISTAEVIDLHGGMDHHVYMIGFLPGLPYLGDLPPALHLPRRTDPRLRVPRGSVAIAVGLTVIYPVESPGGWHIIGRTPAPMFSAAMTPPALLGPGDRVRFAPVDRAEHDRLAAAAEAGEWRPEPEPELEAGA